MKKHLSVIALCTVASAACAEQDHKVTFKPPVMLQTTDGTPVSSDGWAVPYVTDVDGDGKQDLLVGQFMNSKRAWPRKGYEGGENSMGAGSVRFYRNISSGMSPEYAVGVDLQAADGVLSAPNW